MPNSSLTIFSVIVTLTYTGAFAHGQNSYQNSPQNQYQQQNQVGQYQQTKPYRGQGQLSKDDEYHLDRTKKLLRNRQQREAYINEAGSAGGNPAATANDEVKRLTRGNKKAQDQIYGHSADVMEYLTRKYQGNPQALMQAIQQAADDPKAFYYSLPKEIQRGISSTSQGIEKIQRRAATAKPGEPTDQRPQGGLH